MFQIRKVMTRNSCHCKLQIGSNLRCTYIFLMQGPNDAELREMIAKGIEKLKDLEKSPNWKHVGNQPCEKFVMQKGHNSVAKGIYVAPFGLETIMAFLDSEAMMELFTRVLDFKPLYEKKDEFSVGYTRYKLFDNMPAREFVTVTGGGQDGNRVVINSVEVNYPYQAVAGTVRGQVIVGGWILEPIDEKSTRIFYVSETDMKGEIPIVTIRHLAAQEAEIPFKISEAIKKQQK